MPVAFSNSNGRAEPRLGSGGGVYLFDHPRRPDARDVVIRATDLNSLGRTKDAITLLDRAIADLGHLRRLSESSIYHDREDARAISDAHSRNMKLLEEVRRDIAGAEERRGT